MNASVVFMNRMGSKLHASIVSWWKHIYYSDAESMWRALSFSYAPRLRFRVARLISAVASLREIRLLTGNCCVIGGHG